MTNQIIKELSEDMARRANYFKYVLGYTFAEYEADTDYGDERFSVLCEEMGHPIDEEYGIPEELAEPLANWLKDIWKQA